MSPTSGLCGSSPLEPIDATASPPTSNPRARRLAVKYGIDRVVALLALLLFLPLIIGTAIAVWVSLGRPIFFRQVRVGRNGRRFEMLKFRRGCARPSWDDEDEARFDLPPGTAPGGVEGADRRTRVGVRAAHVDRRATAADQRAQGRDELGRPTPRAA